MMNNSAVDTDTTLLQRPQVGSYLAAFVMPHQAAEIDLFWGQTCSISQLRVGQA